jgi:PAS domain S-box-containing protein
MSTSALLWRLKSPVIPNYAIAVLSVAAAVVVNIVFDRLSGVDPSVSLFLCAIMFVAWANGTGPALLATSLTILAFDYFFLHPVHSFTLQFRDIPQLALLVVAALFVVSLNAAQRRTAGSLRHARDEQQASVRELQKLNETLRIENAERKRAELRARLAEQELRATIDTMPALAARHRADGTIDFVNQTWRSYTGFSQAGWKGRGSVITHPDDLAQVEQAWLAALTTGQPFETEQRLRRADGEYRWHFIRRVPLRDDKADVIAWYGAGYDIEDRKRAEGALRRSEAQLAEAQRELQLTIDSIPAFVATYQPDGTRSFVNQAWQNYTGRPLQEAMGAGGKTSLFHPGDLERAENAWRASLATGEPLRMDVRVRTANGEYRWNTHRRVPRRDGKGDIVKWYSVGVDIEDQKIAENALRHSEAQLANAERELRLTLDTIPTLAWRTRSDGFAEYLNKRWLDYTGMTLDQALGWEWQAALHPDDRAGLLDTWRQMLASEISAEVEARMRRFDGAYRWFLFRSEPLRDEAGAVVGWYGTNTDIDDLKQAESEARKSQETLHAAQTALAHASRVATLGEISATIAHEVNQPLAAIVANGQACLRFLRRETPDLDDVRGAVEWIVKDGNRAGEVIRRVRGLLKKADAEKIPLDINDLINEAAALLQRELAAQHVALRLDLAPAMPLAIADRVQLQQVIINLVMNGVEAMRAITGRPHALVIRSHQDEAHQVVVAVKDCGIGIPVKTRDRLFDAFFTTKPSGLGMGLSICRSIIEDHGGRLWATDNGAGPGATFRFALPSQRENAP